MSSEESFYEEDEEEDVSEPDEVECDVYATCEEKFKSGCRQREVDGDLAEVYGVF